MACRFYEIPFLFHISADALQRQRAAYFENAYMNEAYAVVKLIYGLDNIKLHASHSCRD